MKLLRIILLAIVLLAIALFGASYQLPLQINLEQSIVIEAKPEQVFKLLENPSEWDKWSALNTTEDPSMIRLYGGPMYGTGARMQWSGDRVGNGEITFIESTTPVYLAYKQSDTEFALPTTGSFNLERTNGTNTTVLWKHTALIKDEPLARLLGVWQKHKKQDELDRSLQRLQATLIKMNTKPVSKKRLASY
jgi:uncharacterized protein YndB with AHSA1/START domain